MRMQLRSASKGEGYRRIMQWPPNSSQGSCHTISTGAFVSSFDHSWALQPTQALENRQLVEHPIPSAFWDDCKSANLIRSDVLLPD